MYEGLTEDELMQRYQEGDLDALAAMAILLLPKLGAITRKRFSDKSLAEEALQEGLIKVIKSAKSFKHGSKVQTWAYQIINNTYLDLIRRESKRGYLSDDTSALDNRSDNSEEFAEKVANKMTIRSALLKIPKDQAEAVALVWLDGYSVEEAAKILTVPAGTVKSRISRGKDALAEILQDLDPKKGNQKYA